MSTRWVVSTETERLVLDDQRQGVTTLTVTNTAEAADSARVGVVTDDTVAHWFTVDEPVRLVGAGASVPYQLRVTVPPEAQGGEYAVQASVTSADPAPDQEAALSNRIVLEVPVATKPARRPLPRWWWVPIPVAVVLALVVTTIVLLTRPGPDQPVGSPTTAPGQDTVVVPDVTGLADHEAAETLAAAGLDPTIKHRHDLDAIGLVTQSLPEGVRVARGSPIEVVYTVSLSAPTLVSPAQGARLARDASQVFPDFPSVTAEFSWKQAEPWVQFWHFQIRHFICMDNRPDNRALIPVVWQTVTTPSFTMTRYVTPYELTNGAHRSVHSCGIEYWLVRAVDSFGNFGPTQYASYEL